jgi:RNA polymerase sigma factor (sigma-70 family)
MQVTGWSRRRPPKFATIQPVLDSNRELLQDRPKPDGGSQGPGKGSVEEVYRDHLATIDKAARHACRRYGFSREEAEDFAQEVKTKIWTDGCAVLRKHKGRSKLATYLVVVVNHALQDYVNHLWGKWRPSEEAKRHGPLGVQLERLLACDRRSFSEACQILWTNHGVTASEAELADIAAQLPQRLPRRMDGRGEGEGGPARRPAGGSSLAGEPAAVETADERLWRKESARRRERAFQALGAALNTLPPDEWLLVKRVAEGRTVAQIARSCPHLVQKRLYKQNKRILKKLRQALERAGISAEDVTEILHRADT